MADSLITLPKSTGLDLPKLKTIERRIRPFELLMEILIKGVAFGSFAVIVLIVLFVFKEAFPLFGPPPPPPAASGEEVQQETYGEEPSEKPKAREEVVPEEGATVENLAGTEWQPVS